MANVETQGAEARIFKLNWGKPVICKQRFHKKWRHPTLDKKLTKKRVVQEAKCLYRLMGSVDVPTVYLLDVVHCTIYMEFVQGEMVKSMIAKMDNNQIQELGHRIGKDLAKIHNLDIIHGDLTTSNMLVRANGSIVWIDFGLAYMSTLAEDKAVDLYVLERAIFSTHPTRSEIFTSIIESYEKHANQSKEILDRFRQVRQRGRKRTAFG